MTLEQPRTNCMSWKALALVLLYYFSLMCIGLGEIRALTKHEVFTAQPARELLAGGTNPAIQTFGGVPRYQKPPAMTWMIAAGFKVLGEREWVARLPAVIAGGVVVALIALWAARHFGREVGIISGLMQGTFYYVLMQARLAEIDMVLGAVVVGGMLCVEGESTEHQAPSVKQAPMTETGGTLFSAWRLRPWLFALLAGVSMALKGPVGPALMYGGALAYAVLMRSWEIAWRVLHPGRLLLFLAVAVAWPVWAGVTEPGILNFWENELRGRVKDGLQNPEPFWFYVWNVPMLLAPWVLFAVPGWLRWRREEKWEERRGLVLFVAGWFGAGFVLLSAVADKHKHYCIPILPGLTPFLAYGLVAYLKHQYAQPVRWHRVVQVVWALVVGVGIAVVMMRVKEHAVNLAVVLGMLGVGGVVVLEMERIRRRGAQVMAVFATAWCVMAGVNVWVTPVFDNYGVYAELGRRMGEKVPAGEKVWVLDVGMGQIAYYLPLPVGRVDDIKAGNRPERMKYAVLPSASVGKLREVWGLEAEELDRGGKAGSKPRAEDELVLVRVGGASEGSGPRE